MLGKWETREELNRAADRDRINSDLAQLCSSQRMIMDMLRQNSGDASGGATGGQSSRRGGPEDSTTPAPKGGAGGRSGSGPPGVGTRGISRTPPAVQRRQKRASEGPCHGENDPKYFTVDADGHEY